MIKAKCERVFFSIQPAVDHKKSTAIIFVKKATHDPIFLLPLAVLKI
jgi:hypothetical protein